MLESSMLIHLLVQVQMVKVAETLYHWCSFPGHMDMYMLMEILLRVLANICEILVRDWQFQMDYSGVYSSLSVEGRYLL